MHRTCQKPISMTSPAKNKIDGSSYRQKLRGCCILQNHLEAFRGLTPSLNPPISAAVISAYWSRSMRRLETFAPDLWFLAERDWDLVGAFLCFQYLELGWVRQLGVEKIWRQYGIGGALLRHSFEEFYRRDFRRVGLVVRAQNEAAVPF